MTRLKELMAETEQKHLAEVKGLKEELADKNEQQAASAEKTKRLLDEAESSVESENLNLYALKPRPRLGRANSPPSTSFSVVSSYSLRTV